MINMGNNRKIPDVFWTEYHGALSLTVEAPLSEVLSFSVAGGEKR